MVKTEYFSDAYAEFSAAAVSQGQVSLRLKIWLRAGLAGGFCRSEFHASGGGVLHVSGAMGR